MFSRESGHFFEKLMSLVRLSYLGPQELTEKIRHFYDLFKLLQEEDLREKLLVKENYALITAVLQDDFRNRTFAGDWLNIPIAESPLLMNVDDMWTSLADAYNTELPDLIWSDDLPPSESIVDTMKEIRSFMSDYCFPYSQIPPF